MKERTYNLLTHIPFVGDVAKLIIDDPSMGCTPVLADDIQLAIRAYKKAHPDVHITRKIFKEIVRG